MRLYTLGLQSLGFAENGFRRPPVTEMTALPSKEFDPPARSPDGVSSPKLPCRKADMANVGTLKES